MKLNPFGWLNEHPNFRVIGGWLFLVLIVFLDWISGTATPYGPIYCLPVIMISYDRNIQRGIVVAMLAGMAWVLMGTNVGVGLWSEWTEPSFTDRIMQAPLPLQKELARRGAFSPPPIDPVESIPGAVLLWLVGSAGFALVALGFHTIRAQEIKLAMAEAERLEQEKTLLNAITTTLNHEINNPLAIIATQTGLIGIEGGDKRASLRSIQEAVMRISNFVAELSAIKEIRLKTVGSAYMHIDWQAAAKPAPEK